MAKAGILASDANLSSFHRYKCRFTWTKARADTIAKALRGDYTNIRACEHMLTVDGTKEKLQSFAVETKDDRKKLVRQKDGLSMVSVDFMPFTEFRFQEQGLRYSPGLATAGLVDKAEPQDPPVPVPLSLGGVLGARNRLSPARFLEWCESGSMAMRPRGTRILDGHLVLHVNFLSQARNVDYYFDVQRGYLPLRVVENLTSPKGQPYPEMQTHLLEAKEFKKQRWFPMHVVCIWFPDRAQDPFYIHDLRVTDVEVDKTPTHEDFALALPPGTSVRRLYSASPKEHFLLRQQETIEPSDIPRLFQVLQDTPKVALLDTAVKPQHSGYTKWLLLGGGLALLAVSALGYRRLRMAHGR
jgi:hypothetical protein